MRNKSSFQVHIIGAGLAGSEAAWQLANAGIFVKLYEMRPEHKTPAHETGNFAELVCSNSFRSSDFEYNAVGLLHEEMRRLGSIILQCADNNKVPAGGALAVDREKFSQEVTKEITKHKYIEVIRKEIEEIPDDGNPVIIASGPLTTSHLAQNIQEIIGEKYLHFFDALAPVVYTESIDMSKAWHQSRYDKGETTDYINCPLSREQYYNFVEELVKAEPIFFHEWENDTPYFDGCLPIEVMAERGVETLAYGPMKPVGLTNAHNPDEKPYAVVQLRQDNTEDTLRNIVGFQTKLKHGEQTRIFKTIPGLENARFARLGGIHQNTFINSPLLLDDYLRLKSKPNIMFAGQITGCEGYVESSAIGLLAGKFLAEFIENNYSQQTSEDTQQTNTQAPDLPPNTTALGSLLSYVTGKTKADLKEFQPMNINFGLFPEIPLQKTPNGKNKKIKGKERKKYYTSRALDDLSNWIT